MKKYLIGVLLFICLYSCKREFLEKQPQGSLSPDQIQNQTGVEALLTGAYGLLNGNVRGTWGSYSAAPSQWLFGEVASDNAHKGSVASDQPNMNLIEQHKSNSANDNLAIMWRSYYEGILRCNNTLATLKAVQAGAQAFKQERALQIEAEAKMLRGHYYFFLRRLFEKIPYVDETMTVIDAAAQTNDGDVFPKIESDFRFAMANLPDAKYNNEPGRVDKMAATAYLGKLLLYQKKYTEALPLFTKVIAARPVITELNYADNFDVTKKNGPESVFVVQHSVNPDGTGDNANVGDMLSGMSGNAPTICCGFFQPTFDLVNAFKTDADGLPYLDNGYRNDPYKSDFGLSTTEKTKYTLNTSLHFDPRLDYTVGRRGVSFLDYGVMPGDAWILDPVFGGPFTAMKTMVPKSKFGVETVPGQPFLTAQNVSLIRLADVYLMAAECEIEGGNLAEGLRLINLIRQRAAKLQPKTIDGSVNGQPAANYQVGLYKSFSSKEQALNALRFERRLELAMEGHRFFDLVRWGIAQDVIASYSAFEGRINPLYAGISFNPKKRYYPIPQDQIDRSGGLLKQDPNY